MLTVYGLGHCTTTQKAIKYLANKGIQIKEQIDIRDNPPSKETIRLAIEQVGGNVRKIMNTSGNLYREMELKDKLDTMGVDEVITLLSENGMLIKRPLITDGATVSVSARDSTLDKSWIA